MRYRWVAIVAAAAVLGSTTVAAQQAAPSPASSGIGFAARAGATIDPDQFHLGFHVDLGEVAPRLRLQPSLEIGFGSSRTALIGNVDALYVVHTDRTVAVLAGGGLGLGWEWRDDADSRRRLGANLVAAVEWGTRAVPHVRSARGSQLRYALELRLGVGELPDAKVTVSLRF